MIANTGSDVTTGLTNILCRTLSTPKQIHRVAHKFGRESIPEQEKTTNRETFSKNKS